jgi:hypothetical protein
MDGRVSHEWATRPNDQRFLSLDELHAHCTKRAANSRVINTDTHALKAYGTEDSQLFLNTEIGPKFFSNWSFGQVSAAAGAPAGYLKKLTAPLAAACINEGLVKSERPESMIMANGNDTLRCLTSTQYGRIWDHEVVKNVMDVTEGGNWKIPAASYATTDPLRATTLYASDRDVFLFLVDESHPIEVPGMQPMFRGFYAWNSEVGSQVFGLAAFLYERVCDNRNIWGVSHKMELRIRHSAGAPERFLQEGKKTLLEYANESSAPIVERIQRAQSIKLGKDEDEVSAFLRAKGLTLGQASTALNQVKQDGKDILNAWEVTRGITAAARAIPHTDTRVGVERIAGKILDAVV